jgi:flagellar biosynthesis/type III secretory pathway protein FliH
MTEADREKARQALWPGEIADRVQLIAEALAAEREQAYQRGWDDGYIEGNRDGLAAGMGDV